MPRLTWLISVAVALVLTAVMVIALGAPGSQAADSNLLTVLEEPGLPALQPIPPGPDTPGATASPGPPTTPTPTGVGPVPPGINGTGGVGGIAGLLDTDDGAATASGTDGDTVYVVVFVTVIASMLIAGGWYARRRWLR